MTERLPGGSNATAHIPVLLQEVIDALAVAPNDRVVDCTAGGGGHAQALLALLGPGGRYLAIDADETALARVRARVGDDTRMAYACGNFRDIDAHMRDAGLTLADKILLDLGLSSDQLTPREGQGRGFSFQRDEPLAMTFNAQPGEDTLTAYHVVNEWAEESLSDIIFGFGEERRARKIAAAICNARAHAPIRTSGELASIVEQALGRGHRVHPATKTFQAIRMAVNDELGALQAVLEKGVNMLAPGGRIAVISFHSLEDRMVKQTFKRWEEDGIGRTLTKRPTVPTRDECLANRRARSAKLRTFQTRQAHE